jgi:exopolysaccharide biosynthesis polyprenyl glycosylphosphotransferase
MAKQEKSMRFLAQGTMVALDFVIFVSSFVLAFVLTHDTFGLEDLSWFSILDLEPGQPRGPGFYWKFMPDPMWQDFYPYLLGILLPLPIIRFLVMSRLRLYRLTGEISLLEDTIETFRAVTIGTILLIVLAFSLGGNPGESGFIPRRGVFPLDLLICLIGCMALRFPVRMIQIAARGKGRNMTPVILVGRGALAEMIQEELTRDPVIGYRIVHTIEAEGSDPDFSEKLEAIPRLINRTGAKEVFFATQRVTQMQLFPILMNSPKGVNFKVVPNLLGLRPKKVDITRLKYVPLLEIFVDPIRGVNGVMKRILDLTIVIPTLAVLAIPLAIVALIIKFDSPGPVIFKQTRMGLDFRPFPFYKFRSMRVDTDHKRHEEFMREVIQRGKGEVDEKTGKVAFKEKEDPRITRVGRFIRKYSIDELPQLFNVIRGEMSLVGPRPPVPYEVAMYREQHMLRLSAKPGITGIWQVSGRNAVGFEDMVRMDITYMENWSLLTDVKILLQTIPVVLFPRDTY